MYKLRWSIYRGNRSIHAMKRSQNNKQTYPDGFHTDYKATMKKVLYIFEGNEIISFKSWSSRKQQTINNNNYRSFSLTLVFRIINWTIYDSLLILLYRLLTCSCPAVPSSFSCLWWNTPWWTSWWATLSTERRALWRKAWSPCLWRQQPEEEATTEADPLECRPPPVNK